MVSHQPAQVDRHAVKSIRVLLAEDYALVRAGTRALIAAMNGVEVIAETGDGREILQLIKDRRPDVVLLELTMPEMSVLELLQEATRRFPEVSIILLTTHEVAEYAIRAFRAGAVGYLSVSATTTNLEEAIKTVSRGRVYVSREISRRAMIGVSNDRTQEGYLPDKLTSRQREVLTLIAKGYTTKGIGLALNISVKTVEAHRAQLKERLNIYDIAGLVKYAIRMGLLEIE